MALSALAGIMAIGVGILGWNGVAWGQATPGEEIVKQLQAGAGSEGAGLPAPRDPRLVAGMIIRSALGLLGIIFLALIVYAGFLWMTAGGNDEKIGDAKKFIFNGIIGLVIIMSAYAITILAFKLGFAASGNRCTSKSDCAKDEKCSLYGMCVDSYWCQNSNDCANLGKNYVCRNNGCTTAEDLGDYFD